MEFSKICEAYEVLGDLKTKAIYDKYGMESLKNGIAEGPDACESYLFSGMPYKIFEKFFGSANPFINDQHPEDRTLTELQQIDVKLHKEDVKITVECELHEFYCGALKEINYGRIKMHAATDAYTIKNQFIKIEIRPGYGEHTTIRYPGRGHESYGSQPSDLIIKFKLIPKANYSLRGHDIVYVQTCTLIEALELKAFTVQTLDSR